MMVSCNPYVIQKAYFVEPPVTATFDSTRQTRIKLSGYFFNYTDFQVMHSFSEHSGAFVSGMLGYQGWLLNSGYTMFRDKGTANLTTASSLGYIWYNRKPHYYFECMSGYGFQINNARVHEKYLSPFSLIGGPYFSEDVHSAYHRFFIQPSLFTNKPLQWGFALRTELVYCPYYYYRYIVSFYDPFDCCGNSEYEDCITFYNKWFAVITPVFKYQNRSGKSPFGFYFGVNFPTLVKKHINVYDAYEYESDIIKKNPTSANIIFGFEYSFPAF